MFARTLVAAMAPTLLAGCAAIGLAATEALVAVAALGTAAAVVGPETDASSVEVQGNFADERGYWFDRDLYYVSVVSENAEKSERHARATAVDACTNKGKSLHLVESSAWRQRALFAPSNRTRYASWLKFRCRDELDKAP